MRYKPIYKKRHIIQELKKIAKQLKPMEYEVLNKFSKPFYQDAEGQFHNKQAEEGEPKRRMVNAIVEKFPVNHGRRLKKAFQKYGEAGAWGYIMAFKKDEPTEVEKAIAEDMKN